MQICIILSVLYSNVVKWTADSILGNNGEIGGIVGIVGMEGIGEMRVMGRMRGICQQRSERNRRNKIKLFVKLNC